MGKDKIFSELQHAVADFRFDETVANVFPDMIQRSVPGYQQIIEMIGVLASSYAQPGSNCYDLGCSLGAATLTMRHTISYADCRIISVDNSEAMIERCQKYIDQDNAEIPVTVICDDLSNVKIENASIVVLNFTLQFIAPEYRQDVLQAIYDGMLPGGMLICSEKINFPCTSEQQLHEDMHYAFKRAKGYSDLEISQKRSAIEKVLLPETAGLHIDRLQSVGFSQTQCWYQCFNFVSFVAVK